LIITHNQPVNPGAREQCEYDRPCPTDLTMASFIDGQDWGAVQWKTYEDSHALANDNQSVDHAKADDPLCPVFRPSVISDKRH